MDNLFYQLVLTGLAASVSPLPVAVLIDILSFKNPVRSSLVYLLGFTLTLFALGVAALYIIQIGSSSSLLPKNTEAYIDIGLGIACFGLIFFVMRKRPGQEEDRKDKVGSQMKAYTAFILGCVLMITDYSTLVIYVSGLHLIGTAKLGLDDDVLALGLLTFITLLTLMVPIALYIISPEKAGKLLAYTGAWLTKHSKIIGSIILAFFGFYLVMRGLRGL